MHTIWTIDVQSDFFYIKVSESAAESVDFAGDADADAASESSSVPSSELGRTLLSQCSPPNQDKMDFFAWRGPIKDKLSS